MKRTGNYTHAFPDMLTYGITRVSAIICHIFGSCAGANIDPDLLLAVFLPALLFESAFSMEVHQIKVDLCTSFLT